MIEKRRLSGNVETVFSQKESIKEKKLKDLLRFLSGHFSRPGP